MGHRAEFGGGMRGSHEATKARRGEQEGVSIIRWERRNESGVSMAF
jgi:hypothetical protein